MPKAMHHIALNCRDNARAEAFYKKWFGFERALTFTDTKGDPVVFIRLGDFYLELFKSDDKAGGDAGGGPKVMGGEQPVGFKHFALEVDSVADYHERMKDEVTFTVPPQASPALSGMTLAFFKDPDGNIVQLLEGWEINS